MAFLHNLTEPVCENRRGAAAIWFFGGPLTARTSEIKCRKGAGEKVWPLSNHLSFSPCCFYVWFWSDVILRGCVKDASFKAACLQASTHHLQHLSVPLVAYAPNLRIKMSFPSLLLAPFCLLHIFSFCFDLHQQKRSENSNPLILKAFARLKRNWKHQRAPVSSAADLFFTLFPPQWVGGLFLLKFTSAILKCNSKWGLNLINIHEMCLCVWVWRGGKNRGGYINKNQNG